MRRFPGSFRALVLSASLLAGSQANSAWADIVTGSWNLDVEAVQGSPDFDDSDFASSSTFPFAGSLAVTADNTSNTTTYSFGTGATTAFFHTTFEHYRDGSGGSSALSSGSITFTTTGDTTYDLTGGYDLSGLRGIELSVLLVDITDPFNEVELFSNGQTSVATLDQAFVLGGAAGDDGNLQAGSLSGNLESGHTYRLTYDYSIFSSLPPDQLGDPDASATGFLNLDIGLSDVTETIPAPGAVVLAMVGFGVLGWRRGRAV